MGGPFQKKRKMDNNTSYGISLALAANLITAGALVIQKTLASDTDDEDIACPVGQQPFVPCHGSILGDRVAPLSMCKGWGLCLLAYAMLGLGYLLDMLCLSHLSLSSVGALSASQLVFSTMIGWVFLNESLSACGGVGVVCIVTGCIAIVMASPNIRNGKDVESLVIWLTVTVTVTLLAALGAVFRVKLQSCLNEFQEMKIWIYSFAPWVFAGLAGLSASDTLLMSKMLIEVDLFEWQAILLMAIVAEVVLQLHLLKMAFMFASAPGVAIVDPCVVVASTFAVATILMATVCAGVVYGEFDGYSVDQWAAAAGGLLSTALGLCVLGRGRQVNSATPLV